MFIRLTQDFLPVLSFDFVKMSHVVISWKRILGTLLSWWFGNRSTFEFMV